MEEAIGKFKQYLQSRYSSRETNKHYLSDLHVFSEFVGDQSPRQITPKTIDAFVQAQSQ